MSLLLKYSLDRPTNGRISQFCSFYTANSDLGKHMIAIFQFLQYFFLPQCNTSYYSLNKNILSNCDQLLRVFALKLVKLEIGSKICIQACKKSKLM